jgi:hypothetical protein
MQYTHAHAITIELKKQLKNKNNFKIDVSSYPILYSKNECTKDEYANYLFLLR